MSNGTESRGASNTDAPQASGPAHFLRSRRNALDEGTSGPPTTTTVPSMVPQPIYTFITAPKIDDTSHDALTRWLDLRLEYEEAIRARCKTTTEDVAAIMVSVRSSFEESLLDTMCEIKWEKAKEDLTDEYLWRWILETVENFKNKTLPDIDELFKAELVMSTLKSDVDAQVTEYFHKCNMIIRANGLVGLFKSEDGNKKKCKILVSCLPAKTKKRVKNEIDFRLPEAKSSVPVLFRLVSEKALELNREERAIRGTKRGSNHGEHAGEGNLRSQKRQKTTNPPAKQQRGKNSTKFNKNGRETKQEHSTHAPTEGGCWHCEGDHKLRHCPTATSAQKKAAVVKHRQTHGRHRSSETS